MSKNVAVFVDVANLYYAARGQDVDVDYVALLKHATKGRDLIRAYAYSGLDPENENQRKFIDFLGKNGYKVVVKDIRKFGDGRVKANLDIELVVDLFRLADRMDIAVVISGDGDFAPAIRALQDQGVRCEVISFRPNTSGDLIAVADEFIDIMKIASIGRRKDEKPERGAPPTPQMPAKEVIPEFGFREASPAVAAAALAALKGRQNGNGARSAEPAEAGAEDARRRRRRRGGRGRRRADAPAGEAAAAEAAHAEPAWEEFDDLSEVQGLEELGSEIGEEFDPDREYGFEEADEETLRELGLLDAGAAGEAQGDTTLTAPSADGPAASTADAQAVQTAPEPDARAETRRTRRGRRRPASDAGEGAAEPQGEAAADVPSTSAGGSTAEPTSSEEPAAQLRRRGGRRRSTASTGEATVEASDPAAQETSVQPARRRRSSRRAADSGSTAEGDDAQAASAETSTRRASKSPRASGAGTSRRRRTATSPADAGEGETARASTPAGSPSESESGEATQGIWQRFRSARERPKRS